MRFAFIQLHARIYHVTTMCRVLEVSRAGFYAWRARPLCQRVQDDTRLRARIRQIYAAVKGRYGSPRVRQELRWSVWVVFPAAIKFLRSLWRGWCGALCRAFRPCGSLWRFSSAEPESPRTIITLTKC